MLDQCTHVGLSLEIDPACLLEVDELIAKLQHEDRGRSDDTRTVFAQALANLAENCQLLSALVPA
jgi:hypothetical protein